MKRSPSSHAIALAALLVTVSPALAVKTQHFTQTSAEDFKKGSTQNTVVTNIGQLKLSRKIDALLPKDRQFDAIQAMAEAPDGSLTLAAFPDGEVMSLKEGKLTTLATFKDQTVTSLAYDKNGRLLIGVGGEKAQLVRIDKPGDKPAVICEPADAKYIWAILPETDATYLATGPTGGLFKVGPDGKAETIAELAGDNVLCLTADKTSLYAGTDGEALIYKIDRQTGKPFVLYDAAESEISALAWDSHGNLLACTSDPHDNTDAEPPSNEKPGESKSDAKPAGKNEMPGKKPAAPKPPEEKPGDAIPHTAAATPENAPASAPARPNEPAVESSPNKPEPGAGPGSNAVYRIDPQGLVTEVFRKSAIFYGMAAYGDSIVLATGDDGEIFEIKPDTDEEAVLFRTDAPDATGLLTAKDGTLYVATSNVGQVYRLSSGLAKEGTYESDVLDAVVPSNFGNLHLLGTMPAGTKLTVQTRTGNVADPEDNDWADWTTPVPATEYVKITSGPGRYLQYRLSFQTSDAGKSAVVDEVDVAYQRPNLPPKIGAISVLPGETPGSMNIAWEASDGNDDELRFGLFVRATGQGTWMKIADELTETTHAWTSKNTPNGTYEIKVVASDALANPPGTGRETSRISDGLLVDNTPPLIGDVKVSDDKNPTVTFRVVDRAGTVASVETTVDRIDHWQKQLPDDKMADSPEERYTVPVTGLASGSHTLMIRATDARGNTSYETVAVKVP